MSTPKEYLEINRAALFDWIVLISSFLLGFAFPSLRDLIHSPGFYNWILAALLLYTFGAALKHLPLSYRMSFSGKNYPMVPYVIFLLIGHWFIILIMVILAEPAIRTVLSLPPANKDDISGGLIFGAITAALVVTWMVYRTKSNRKKRKPYSERFLFWQEIVADIFLTAGVSIFSFIFWEKGVMEMLSRASTDTFGDIWFLFIFLAMLFLFFYLPLRYLFFVEDREKAKNRRRLLFIFVFILLKALLETIGI